MIIMGAGFGSKDSSRNESGRATNLSDILQRRQDGLLLLPAPSML